MALSTDFTWAWEVTQLKRKDEVNSEGATLSGAVCQTFWKVTGTDANGNTGEFSGATPFSAANTPAGSFVAFDDLTEFTPQEKISRRGSVSEGICMHAPYCQ